MNLVQRIAGAARLLATGKLAQNPGFEGAQMQRARARQLVRTNPYAPNAAASFTAHAVGAGIKPSSLVEDAALKDRIQRLWLAWTDEADADGLTDFYGLQAMAARAMFEAGECFFRFRPRRPDDGLTPIFDSWGWRETVKAADFLGSGMVRGQNVVPRIR